MKKIITILLLVLSNIAFCQSEVIEIEYEVNLTDPLTGLKKIHPYMDIDWQFNVKFDSSNVKIWRKFTDDFYETRIINKNNKEVLLLKSESKNKYTFYVSTSTMLNMDMSSNYGDTSIIITDEHKDILGYDCYKVEMDFGGQANALLWVTDSLTPGVIIPETPLSMEAAALEYRFESPTQISEFKAKDVAHKSETIDNTSIPDEYLLIVPVSVFELNNETENDSGEFDFVQYPKYPNGKAQLHLNIRKLCSLHKKNKNDDLLDFNVAFISFTVKKDGTLENIHIQGVKNENEMDDIMKFLSKSIFTPGIVKGEKVNSAVKFSVSLDE